MAFNKLAVAFIAFVSVFFRTFGGRACRFHPSCSHYAAEVFGRFGFAKAFWFSARRLLKCHPFSQGGVDEI